MPGMRIAVAAAIVALGFAFCGAPPARAASASAANAQSGAAAASDLSAQKTSRARRTRPQITIYPRATRYAYPGPNAVRECTSWLEQEARPSGTVIVPRMRCWWRPG